jgi:phosphoglucomutase
VAIRFGTSGWRALLADEFTFPNVRIAARAVARHVRSLPGAPERPRLIAGGDSRFLSQRFAEEAGKAAVAEGVAVDLCPEPVPTPTIAHAIMTGGYQGGINITASHNPPEWNGLKFNNGKGAPAPPEETDHIEALVAEVAAEGGAGDPLDGAPELGAADPGGPYLDRLAELVDFEAIRKASLRVGADPLFGAGRGYLDEALRRAGAEVLLLHDRRDVTFGGGHPEPDAVRLEELSRVVREQGCALGVACDGDADRFGVVDGDGTFVWANRLLGLLLDYLAETRGWKEGVGRTVATSHLLDRVATWHGMPVYETPVGFKFLGDLILEGKACLVGEESAGASILGHLPEKDGILICLLAAEMVARTGKSLAEITEDLFRRVGPVHTLRVNLRLTPELKTRLASALDSPPDILAGRAVSAVTRVDGTKLQLGEGAWIMLRLSGTEPVARLYVEAESPEDVDALAKAGQELALGR